MAVACCNHRELNKTKVSHRQTSPTGKRKKQAQKEEEILKISFLFLFGCFNKNKRRKYFKLFPSFAVGTGVKWNFELRY